MSSYPNSQKWHTDRIEQKRRRQQTLRENVFDKQSFDKNYRKPVYENKKQSNGIFNGFKGIMKKDPPTSVYSPRAYTTYSGMIWDMIKAGEI